MYDPAPGEHAGGLRIEDSGLQRERSCAAGSSSSRHETVGVG